MNEIFETIGKLPKGNQFNILLELLQEKGGTLHDARMDAIHQGTSLIQTVDRIKPHWQDCEAIKERIKQLYNENISNESPVQNIAQP